MVGGRLRAWLIRNAPLVLVAVVPTLLLGFGVLQYMLNHIFYRPPYLFDTGMLSGLTYENGLLLPVPEILCERPQHYWEFYASPMTAVFSMLSYLSPVRRLEWFSLLQSLVYVPMGIVVYALSSRLDAASALRRLPVTIVAALAFALNGFVLSMISYPHFEVAMPALTCLVLAALVTGRARLAWVLLVVAASVRQDGGIHVAMAITPLLYLHWRGVAMAPSRRRLVTTIGIAIGLSLAGMLFLKIFFASNGRIDQAYVGHFYSHLTWDLARERARQFLETNQLVYYPVVATCIIALLRRDARYLLGWAALIPWFLFSFTAREPSKASFFAYVAGPFITGMFWVYLYGAFLAPPAGRLRIAAVEILFALVCVSSTLGLARNGSTLRTIVSDMVVPNWGQRTAINTFVDGIRTFRPLLGRLRGDAVFGTFALTFMQLAEFYGYRPGDFDSVGFHTDGGEVDAMMADLAANQIDRCHRASRTGLVLCSRYRLPVEIFGGAPVESIPTSFARAVVPPRTPIVIDARGIVFRRPAVLNTWLGRLPRGTYEWTVSFAVDDPGHREGTRVRVEVIRGDALLGAAEAPNDARSISVRFETDGSSTQIAHRVRSWSGSPLTITGATLRRTESRGD